MAVHTLVHLSGPERGATWPIAGHTVRVVSGQEGLLAYATRAQPGDGDLLFTLTRTADGHRIDEPPQRPVWVNGVRARGRQLASGDLIEVGNGGPVLRYRLSEHPRGYKRVADALGDCVDCARYGGRGPLDRASVLLFGPFWELGTQATPGVRLTGLLALTVVAASMVGLWRQNARLEQALAAQTQRVEGLERLLARSESADFDRDDFERARGELDFRIDDTLARIEALESRAGARGRVIAEASRAVIFLQGAYGFVDPDTGRPLRRLAGAQGSAGPLTLSGDGPPLELRYTGTGFVVGDEGLVITNRHVALPWDYDEAARELIGRGYTPVMRRFVGYLPQIAEPFEVDNVGSHGEADVALLRCDGATRDVVGLRLAEREASLGEEIVVLGYPAGMRALLARAGTPFVDRAMAEGPIDFWQLAARLAAEGLVEPLATAGVVGQAGPGSLVYDAETTHGGSGGPVLSLDGTVLAINAAIVPEFGGSNLGVPARLAAELIAAVGQPPGSANDPTAIPRPR